MFSTTIDDISNRSIHDEIIKLLVKYFNESDIDESTEEEQGNAIKVNRMLLSKKIKHVLFYSTFGFSWKYH